MERTYVSDEKGEPATMKTMVISYSLSGNNEELAKSLAAALGAEHVRVKETRRRTTGTTIADMLFNRRPRVTFPASPSSVERFDLVIFVGPVWMGHVATPFRSCFHEIGPKIGKYAYISICGGADGPNPELAEELAKRLAKRPLLVLDLHIADLLPQEPRPRRQDTSSYRLNEGDVVRLTASAMAEIAKLQ
jgi:hypothetical protein